MEKTEKTSVKKEFDRPIFPHKRDLITEAFRLHTITSLVDIGGCYGVNGGYTFHALALSSIDRAFILDGRITDLTKKRAEQWPQVTLLQGDLGDPRFIEQIGYVDAAICYEVLLHQVAPNWDEFLRAYAERVRVLIIYNQNYMGSKETLRFIDEGIEGYFKHTPYREMVREKNVQEWFGKHDQLCPELNRKWRDVHFYWQWGITQSDLIRVLWEAGFQVDYLQNYGFWPGKSTIQNQGLICSKVRN